MFVEKLGPCHWRSLKLSVKLLSYYANFKVRKIESLFYKINTCFHETNTCIGLLAEQILSVKK